MPDNHDKKVSLLEPSRIGVGVDLSDVQPQQQCVVIYDDSWPDEKPSEVNLFREELVSVIKALNKAAELLGIEV